MFTHTPPIRLMPDMWSLSHTCHVGNQVSSPNQTKKVKKLIKPSNAHLPTSCFSISHSWLLLKEQHASLCVFVAGKKVTDPFLDLQNSRQALASKKAILASHHFSTGVEDSKGSKKTQPPKHPQRCRERQGCRSFAAFYPFFCFYHFAPRNQFGHSHIDLCHGTIKTKCLRHHRHHAPANTADHEGCDVL